MPEVATQPPSRAQKHWQISRCRSQTFVSPLSLARYADAPEGNCRKDTPRRPRSKHAQGPSNALKLSGLPEDQGGSDLGGRSAFRSRSSPSCSPLPSPQSERGSRTRHVLGAQSNCPLLRDPVLSHLPGIQSGPADSLIRKRSARVCLSIIAALIGWIAVLAPPGTRAVCFPESGVAAPADSVSETGLSI
jgi:hypothetical protein